MGESCEKYVFLMPVEAGNTHTPGDTASATAWLVSIAHPASGSIDARNHEALTVHGDTPTSRDGDAMTNAVVDFVRRMKETGLPGVLDAADIRLHDVEPINFCHRLTERIIDDIDNAPGGDVRDDDFENHPLAPLREAMVDACPEYSGMEPDVIAP